jgi:transcriptional regulator of acetoin/glycerol metabolism
MLPEQFRKAAAEQLPPTPEPATAGLTEQAAVPDGPELVRPFWQIERDTIQTALDLCRGNVQDVARRLELSPATLYRKIEKYGLVK